MRYSKLYSLFFLLHLLLGCNSDDDDDEPTVTTTSFSGVVVYQNMNPVTNGELFITGSDSRGLSGSVVVENAMLQITDGTFDVTFDTVGDIDNFDMFIDIFQGEFIINTFVAGSDPPLQCLPGDCGHFEPGQDYELTIIVPCTIDDCVLFPPNG